MKIVDMMEKVFQMHMFNDRINIINKSFPNLWRVQCSSYSSAFKSLHIAGLINSNKKCPVWIGGDFNLLNIDWQTRSVISHQYSKDKNDKFVEVIDDFYFEQLVTFPICGSNKMSSKTSETNPMENI